MNQQHQIMGYDRAITMFSPDGRLLQVEYAKKTVKQGSTAIGIKYNEGVVLLADKRVLDPLIVPSGIEKISEVDDHIIIAASGIISDARVLVERVRVKSQQHKITYNTNIDVVSVVKEIADLKQLTTQSGGYRPFGVSLLIAGYDIEPKLYETDPTGIYFEYKASVIGEGEEKARPILHKEYKDNMSFEEAVKLGIKALKEVLGEKFSSERIDISYVDKGKKSKFLTEEEKQKYL